MLSRLKRKNLKILKVAMDLPHEACLCSLDDSANLSIAICNNWWCNIMCVAKRRIVLMVKIIRTGSHYAMWQVNVLPHLWFHSIVVELCDPCLFANTLWISSGEVQMCWWLSYEWIWVQATSEVAAEKQIRQLLFPRSRRKKLSSHGSGLRDPASF